MNLFPPTLDEQITEVERERAARVCRGVADDQYSAWAEVCETRIRALPLTPEEPT